MSLRPNRSGARPWSSRARRLSDSRASALTFSRTLVAPPPRCRGSSSPAHALAARASHGWLMPVNDSRPGWPNTARSQLSPARSRPGSVSARRTSRATAASNTRVALVGHTLGRAGADGRGLLSAQRVADRPQGHIGDLRPAPDALLDTEQHLDHHQRWQPPQAHLPALGDRGLRSAASAAGRCRGRR